MQPHAMRRFWDARARENPFYFVDNRLVYDDPDLDRFWAGGKESMGLLLGDLAVAIRPGCEVVEIGCGVGRVTRALAAEAARVRALDVSEEMLTAARDLNAELDNVEWILGDGVSLAPLGDGSADACFSDVVFQHIPDPEITLGYVAEMVRVLRPGGWAAFQISNDPKVHARRRAGERLRSRLRAIARRGPRGQAHPAWLGSAIDLDGLAHRALDAGGFVERVTGAGTQYCRVLVRRSG